MSGRLRAIAHPFVVAAPSGMSVPTRLRVSHLDEEVLIAIGTHLGSLAGGDLALRCSEGRLDTRGKAASRRVRKQALTAKSSSRWAGAITRTSEDAWSLAERNLGAEVKSLRSRINRINRRLAIPVGQRQGATSGYPTRAERFQHQQRLQVLCCRLRVAEAALASGEMSICRGGRRLARARHNLEQAGLTEESWTKRWEASRMFLTADGEAGKAWGNETIRFNPDAGSLEIKLPSQLSHLANAPHGRYRLTCDVSFSYRADDVAAQAASGAVRYDITLDPDKARWYLRAAWKTPPMTAKTLEELQGQQVLGVDLNPAHLAAVALDASGNPLGGPVTIPLALKGCLASTRDAQVRAAISELIAMAHRYGAHAIVIEDLNFEAARDEGREHSGRRPSRGRRGRAFRGLVAGIPTAAFRGRLVQMAANQGLSVIAVDPAYTSIWGAEHWLGCLNEISPATSGHHAAALVIGRRGKAQRARRRAGRNGSPPEDGRPGAASSAVGATPAAAGLCYQRIRGPGDPEGPRAAASQHKTRPAKGTSRATRTPKTARGAPRSMHQLLPC